MNAFPKQKRIFWRKLVKQGDGLTRRTFHTLYRKTGWASLPRASPTMTIVHPPAPPPRRQHPTLYPQLSRTCCRRAGRGSSSDTKGCAAHPFGQCELSLDGLWELAIEKPVFVWIAVRKTGREAEGLLKIIATFLVVQGAFSNQIMS